MRQSTDPTYCTIPDKGGAVVPGVAVTVTHVETGTSRSVKSDAAGGYVFVQLPVGHFTLSAQAPGFKEYLESDMPLQVGENRPADLALRIGNVTEKIEVQ